MPALLNIFNLRLAEDDASSLRLIFQSFFFFLVSQRQQNVHFGAPSWKIDIKFLDRGRACRRKTHAYVLWTTRTSFICFSFSACNKTYFGEVGKTYDLELHRPKEEKIPFICHLMFSAGGGEFGDLVQVNVHVWLFFQEKSFGAATF